MPRLPTETQSDVQEEGGGKSRCNHTLYLRNSEGKPLGFWVEQRNDNGIRVVCRYCQKFYGYRKISRTTEEDRLYQAYLEQQRRLACPGCGEEPFMG